MPSAVARGRAEEDRAASYLIEQGYTIVTRRYKAPRGEIDIVALDGDLLVFVEVKARWAPGYAPEEAVGQQKLKALSRAAQSYLAYIEEPDRAVRFDIIAIDSDGLRHYLDILGESKGCLDGTNDPSTTR